MSRGVSHAAKLLFVMFVIFMPQGHALMRMMIERPAFVLVAVLAVWTLARALGVGGSLGYESARELDILVTGGLTAIIGLYALACRGVGLSGLVSTALLTAAYLTAVVRRHGRPGAVSGALTALTWCAVLYRFARPL